MAISSYISPKVRKGVPSGIEGSGLLAIAPIARDEIVAMRDIGEGAELLADYGPGAAAWPSAPWSRERPRRRRWHDRRCSGPGPRLSEPLFSEPLFSEPQVQRAAIQRAAVQRAAGPAGPQAPALAPGDARCADGSWPIAADMASVLFGST